MLVRLLGCGIDRFEILFGLACAVEACDTLVYMLMNDEVT